MDAKGLHIMRAHLRCARTDALLVRNRALREWGKNSSIGILATQALTLLDEGVSEIDIELKAK